MNNTLIVNLGSNDLKVTNVEKLKEIFENDEEMLKILEVGIRSDYKVCCKKILDKLDECIKFLEFPIISSVLKKIIDKSNEEKLDRIIFVCTDQGHFMDTIYLGEVLQELKKKKKDKNDICKLMINVNKIVINVVNDNPSSYDFMNNYYNKMINNINAEKLKKLYISITGGIPAMNTSLLYSATNEFYGKVVPYYVSKKRNSIYTLQISNTIMKRDIERTISDSDYKAAIVLLEDYKNRSSGENDNKTISAMKSYLYSALSRIQFDFEKSMYEIQNCMDEDKDNLNIYENYFDYVQKMYKGEDKEIYLLNEVKNNAIYKYRNGAYTDFLGRIFRLQEGVCNYILNRYELITIEKDKPCINKEILNKSYADKIKCLGEKTIDGQLLKYEDVTLNTVSMLAIVEVLFNEDTRISDIIRCCKKIDKLKKARNKSILAHGYTGISKESIVKNVGGEEVESILNEIIDKLKETYEINFIDDGFYDKENDYKKVMMELVNNL